MTSPTSNNQAWSADIVVIGGGAAGYFAAIHAAEAAPRAKVMIVEKGKDVLTKVRISGGGRCNVTHACFEPNQLVKSYPRGNKELRGPFHNWQPTNTIEWFQEHGVELKTEEDGRMFPTTDSSETIIDCLATAARKAGVQVNTNTGIKSLEKTEQGFALTTQAGPVLHCRRLLVATGGMKPGGLTKSLETLGHTITALAPSLFTFHIKDPRISELPGLATQVTATIPKAKLQTEGPALITHWGLSGPAILRLSAWGARWIQERGYRFEVFINWTGEHSRDKVLSQFKNRKETEGKKQIANRALYKIPRRLWASLLKAAEISDSLTWAQASGQHLKNLAGQLTECRFQVTGKTMNKEEFVTCGGINLKEVHFKTMESRKVSGLHFAGEVLDIDGITGGFNFQAAWTTGRAAGLAMGEGVSE